MLKKEYIRDGKRRIIVSITSGYSGGTSDVVRDASNQITGRAPASTSTQCVTHTATWYPSIHPIPVC